MKVLSRIAVGLTLGSLLISLSACVSNKPTQPEHKAKTTACLIRSAEQVPGSPEKQLAADLVEAQVVYGLAVREVEIPNGVGSISTRLLASLQSGCVLMVSANTSYLNDLATFARLHSKMMVLFVGGTIASVDQPANFRWIADDAVSGAKLAGLAAAAKATDGKVRLFIQPSYFQAKETESAFKEGVAYYNRVAGSRVALVVFKVSSSKDLSEVLTKIEPTATIAIFAGKSVWQGLTSFDSTGPAVIGADIQFGNTVTLKDSRVIASVERNTSSVVLRAVSSLLAREITSNPKYRVSQTLKLNLIVLKTLDAGAFDEALTERLNSYKQVLVAAKTN